MVRAVQNKKGVLFVCEACGLLYKEKAWALKCEDFCTKHHACSLEITRYAVGTQEKPFKSNL